MPSPTKPALPKRPLPADADRGTRGTPAARRGRTALIYLVVAVQTTALLTLQRALQEAAQREGVDLQFRGVGHAQQPPRPPFEEKWAELNRKRDDDEQLTAEEQELVDAAEKRGEETKEKWAELNRKRDDDEQLTAEEQELVDAAGKGGEETKEKWAELNRKRDDDEQLTAAEQRMVEGVQKAGAAKGDPARKTPLNKTVLCKKTACSAVRFVKEVSAMKARPNNFTVRCLACTSTSTYNFGDTEYLA